MRHQRHVCVVVVYWHSNPESSAHYFAHVSSVVLHGHPLQDDLPTAPRQGGGDAEQLHCETSPSPAQPPPVNHPRQNLTPVSGRTQHPGQQFRATAVEREHRQRGVGGTGEDQQSGQLHLGECAMMYM